MHLLCLVSATWFASAGIFSTCVAQSGASPDSVPLQQNRDLKEHLATVGERAAAIAKMDTAMPIFRSIPATIDGKPMEKLAALDSAGAGFVRNSTCWAPVDLTPISACQFDVDPRRPVWTSRLGMTLISPRHVLMAKHNNITNTDVIFVSAENRMVRRKMIDAAPVETAAHEDNDRPVYADFYVGLLDQDVDKSIYGVDFAKILPLDFVPSLRSGALAPFLPVMHTNQDREVRVMDWISGGRRGFNYDLFFSAPGEIELSKSYKAARSGDSGSPIFTTINGQFVLLSVFHTPIQGSSVAALRAEINAAMAALQRAHGSAAVYQLTEADTAGFTRPTRRKETQP